MGWVNPWVGSGPVGYNCVGLCGSPGMIQNVLLNVIAKFTFSELLLLLMFELMCTLCLHLKSKFH